MFGKKMRDHELVCSHCHRKYILRTDLHGLGYVISLNAFRKTFIDHLNEHVEIGKAKREKNNKNICEI